MPETNEVVRIRDRLHEIAQSTQELITKVEELEDQQKETTKKLENLTQRVLENTISSTRAEVSMGTTLATHIEQCKTDKQDVRNMISANHASHVGMHQENKKALEEQSQRLNRIEVRIGIYCGIAIGITWLIGTGLSQLKALFN